MVHQILNDKATKLFIFLGGLFIASALISEIIGVKIFSLEDTLGIQKFNFSLFGVDNLSLNLSVGVVPWPIIFIMTDVINDYYGVKGVRFLTFLTVFLIALAFVIFYFSILAVPDATWWLGSSAQQGVPNMQSAYSAILGQGMNIIIGSLSAFTIGQLVDAAIFKIIKKKTGEHKIWLRSTFSTLVSQMIDSFVVMYIAFYFLRDMGFAQCTAAAMTSYFYKFIVAILATPFIYLIHGLIEKYLGKDLSTKMKKSALETNL